MKYLTEWVTSYQYPRRWMAFVFYSCRRDQSFYAAFPLNLLISLVWWGQDKWARVANAPSWIEREVRWRVGHHDRITQDYSSYNPQPKPNE